MKDLNMENDDIKNELSTLLDSYESDLIQCLIYKLNQPLFQSILLRLKLQNKLKLNDNSLVNSFNSDLHPLIKYLINFNESKNREVKKKTSNSVKKEKEINLEENNSEEDTTIKDIVNEYINECIDTDENEFLLLAEVYDDFSNDWLESKGKNNDINESDFVKYFNESKGKITTKKGKKGWKNLKILD